MADSKEDKSFITEVKKITKGSHLLIMPDDLMQMLGSVDPSAVPVCLAAIRNGTLLTHFNPAIPEVNELKENHAMLTTFLKRNHSVAFSKASVSSQKSAR